MLTNDPWRHEPFSILLQAFEHMPVSIFLLAASGRILYANQAALTLTAYSRAELAKTDVQQIFNAFLPAHLTTIFRDVASGTDPEVTQFSVITRKDGSKTNADLHISIVADDNDRYLLVTVNGNKEGEAPPPTYSEQLEKAAESERRFRALFDHSQDGIALLSAEGIILDVSPSIEKIIGFKKEELVGTSRVDFILEEDVHLVHASFEAVLNEPLNSRVAEYRATAKDGRQTWLECSYRNLLNEPSVNAIVLNFRDITERKKAENRLKESEASYRKAQTQGKLGHWAWDLATNQLTWSDEIYNMFGLAPADIFPTFEKFISCIHSDDRELVEKEISRSIMAGKGYQLTYRITLDDGTIRHIYTVAELVRLPSGEVVRVVGMVQDVTEQKKIEEELGLSERNYRLLFEKSPVPFWMIDYPSFDFIEANQAATDLYGYSREEFLTMNVRDIRLDPDARYYERMNSTMAEGETHKLTALHKKKNGDVITVQVTVSSNIYNGRMVRLASTRDITQERLFEKQLQDKEHQLSLIFNNTVNGMALFKVEPEGQYRFEAVNDALCSGLKIERENVLEKKMGDVFGPHNIQHILPGFNQAVVTGSIQSFTAESTRRIGNRIVEYTAIPIKNEEGRVVRLLSISHDVTEKIKAENDLLRINNELRLLSSHLERIREEERTNISREIHDELGQQLTGLKMEISWIKRHLRQQNDEIKTRIQSSLVLIDNTINSVRRIAAQLRPSILDDLGLAEALDWQGQEFSRRTGVFVTFSSNTKTLKFSSAITIALFRIFQEALTNVARHAKATNVRSSLKKENNWLCLSVVDNGIGFSADVQEGRKPLGLLGMEERVAALKGQFALKSCLGRGTTILVKIPLD